MSYLRVFGICVIALTLIKCAANKIDDTVDRELNILLEQKQYFELDRKLTKNANKLSDHRRIFYNAFVEKAFGRNSSSINYIDIILNRHKGSFNDSLVVELLDLKAANYIHEYNYSKASETYSKILKEYPTLLDSTEINEYTNVERLFGAFADVEPMIKQPHLTVKINAYRNNFNHLMTPVQSNNISEHFVFDTGANLSTISESMAKKMNLTIIEKNINVGSSTNLYVNSKLAVAENFYVGDILFNNVLFLVMPDTQLTFPDINYQIKGIIGFPVIEALGEMHLHKNGNITVPDKPNKSKLNNMVLEGLNPVVELFSGNESLLLTLDTGAKNSELSFKYYRKHKDVIETTGRLIKNKRGGAGGMTNVKEYLFPNFQLIIGTKKALLEEVHVTLEEYEFTKHFDGNLGQDVFVKFDTLILNFKDMYIDLN